MLTQQVLRELATTEPRRLLISVYARTDPRDPANIGSSPAWLIQLRNGLRAISERLESGDDRESRLAFRTLRRRIEQSLTSLTPAERARSVAWVLDADGYSERFSLQLPLRRDRIVADTKPFVSPLVDIADRGAPVGVILVGGGLAGRQDRRGPRDPEGVRHRPLLSLVAAAPWPYFRRRRLRIVQRHEHVFVAHEHAFIRLIGFRASDRRPPRQPAAAGASSRDHEAAFAVERGGRTRLSDRGR